MTIFSNNRRRGRSSAAVAILFLASAPGNSQQFLFLGGVCSNSAGSSRTSTSSAAGGDVPARGPGAGSGRGRLFSTLLASIGPGGCNRDGNLRRGISATDGPLKGRRRRLGLDQVRAGLSRRSAARVRGIGSMGVALCALTKRNSSRLYRVFEGVTRSSPTWA